MRRFTTRWFISGAVMVLLWAGWTDSTRANDSDPNVSQLWNKATAYMQTYHWVPGTLHEQIRTYDLRGHLEEERRLVIGYTPDGHSRIRKSLLAALEDGRDITWQVRATVEDIVTFDDISNDSPLAPAEGQAVTAHFNGSRQEIDGHVCFGFDFILIGDNVTMEGIAWLDRQTGLPTQIHRRVSSVPFMQGGVNITSYLKSDYYALTEQGNCVLERDEIQMDVAMPKLWFKGQVKTQRVFRNHWKFTVSPQNHVSQQARHFSCSLPFH
jgi:hypothetical protein